MNAREDETIPKYTKVFRSWSCTRSKIHKSKRANRPKWQFAERAICIELKSKQIKLWWMSSIYHSKNEKNKTDQYGPRFSFVSNASRCRRFGSGRSLRCYSSSLDGWCEQCDKWHEDHVSMRFFLISLFSSIIKEKKRWYASDRTAYISFLITHRVETKATGTPCFGYCSAQRMKEMHRRKP